MNILYDGYGWSDTAVQAPSQKESSLIRDTGAEKLMYRLEKIEKEQKELLIREKKNEFKNAFLSLAHKFFGINNDEMRKLDEDELDVLRRMIAHRVKKRFRTFFIVNGFFCAAIGALAIGVHGLFSLFSVLLVFNFPIFVEIFQHHFQFHEKNKRIEKLTPDML